MKNFNKWLHNVLYLVLALVICVGCNNITEGEIIEKWYEPEHNYVTIMPVTISNGKTTTTMMIPYYIYDGEDYCIKIKGINKKGKEKIKTIYVRGEHWQKLDKGQCFRIDGDCSEKDFTYKKEKR